MTGSDSPTYKGKHEAKLYHIWRVIGPAGPEEMFVVYGIKFAKEAILGCWDFEVRDENGKDVTWAVIYG